jgi:hypothetical protein
MYPTWNAAGLLLRPRLFQGKLCVAQEGARSSQADHSRARVGFCCCFTTTCALFNSLLLTFYYSTFHYCRVQSNPTQSTDGVSCSEDAPEDVKISLPEWATNYSFTGSLRPALISPRRAVPAHIRKPDYANNMSGISNSEQRDKTNHNNIRIYTSEELDGETGLRHACRMGREVLDVAGKALRPGVTTDEIDRIVHEACMERDCYPSPLNYYNFPKSVCTSVNEVICHGIPDYREIQDGGKCIWIL